MVDQIGWEGLSHTPKKKKKKVEKVQLKWVTKSSSFFFLSPVSA